MNIEELKNSLLAAPKNGFSRLSADERNEMEAHARGYAAFIDACKTERETVVWAIEELNARGIKPTVYRSVSSVGGPEQLQEAYKRYDELGY